MIGNADQSFVFISDNDQIRPSLSLSSTSITERAGINGQEQTVDVIVRLNVSSVTVQSVPISVSRATFAPFATYQNDFSLDVSDFVFQPGQTELRRTLTIHDDAITEGDESVRIVLANSDSANLLSSSDDRVKELKIRDDDFSVDVIAPSNVSEDSGSVTFTMRRPDGADNSGLVYLSFIGTATQSGSRKDVALPASQTIFFLNESEKTVTVNLIDDTNVEDPETIGLIVERLVGNEFVELDRATVTITDDDAPPTVGISQPLSGLFLDGTESTSIPITLSQPSDKATFIDVKFSGDGLLNEDFLVAGNVLAGANPGTLSVFIPAGSTESSISIQAIPKNVSTPDRQVEVVVVGSLNGLVPYNPPRTTVTIPGVERATASRGSQTDRENLEKATNGQLQIDEAAANGSTGGNRARINAPSSNSDGSNILAGALAFGVQNTGLIDGGTVFFDADFDGRLGFVDVNEDGRQGTNEPSET
ncbi:MAG: hypothetical protein KDA89_02265, partial [Planctomycetaceae bacterium]|nr:hypothetical protein [Planctomycetaceae bacterium]